MNRPIEDLQYAVEEWTVDNVSRVEIIARAGILSVAWSAFWAALAARPRGRIVLRQKAHELANRGPRK